MKEEITAFDNKSIRRQFDEETETWYFSVVDIIEVLTESENPRRYWSDLKRKLSSEGSQVYEKIVHFKMTAPDGKKRLTDVADVETLMRLIQTIPSPKAEPIKLWLARVGYERIKETEDPEAGIARARSAWKKQGRSDDWINQRMLSIRVRNSLTDFWDDHGIKEGAEFARLTGITHKAWTGLSVREHKNMKGLKSQNLRDHMSDAELVLTMLAEISTKQIAEKMDATGFDANAEAAKDGGGVAKKAREELESKSGKSALSGSNFLPKKK